MSDVKELMNCKPDKKPQADSKEVNTGKLAAWLSKNKKKK